MKITPIGRLFHAGGWESYSTIELEADDIAAAADCGLQGYVDEWLRGREGGLGSLSAVPHPRKPAAFLVIGAVDSTRTSPCP